MTRKLALKRLTMTDLSLFTSHFERRKVARQKGFNLHASVFAGAFYPALSRNAGAPPVIPVDVDIEGPGPAENTRLHRTIRKESKNWRLSSGRLIDAPPGDPMRYSTLVAGDFVLLEFCGEPEPHALRLRLVAAAVPRDVSVHAYLNRWFPGGGMRVMSDEDIRDMRSTVLPHGGCTLREWIDGGLQEDLGGEGLVALPGDELRGEVPFLSAAALLERLRDSAAAGAAGEALLNRWLEQGLHSGEIQGFEWTSRINAVAPFDFSVTGADAEPRVLEAKSTAGDFSRPFHLSLAELREAVHGTRPYDICRLYELTPEGAYMRIARDAGNSLREVLATLRLLPTGVSVDSVAMDPEILPFSSEVIRIEASPCGAAC